jgi:hypothetical protein
VAYELRPVGENEPVPILRVLSVIMALVLGLGVGFVLIIFFWFGMAAIGHFLLLLFGTTNVPKISNGVASLFIFGLYAIWFAGWLFAFLGMSRAAGKANSFLVFLFVFLVVLPLPSIFGIISMMAYCSGQHGGQCG